MTKSKRAIAISTLLLVASVRSATAFFQPKPIIHNNLVALSASATSSSSRQKRVSSLTEWGKENKANIGGVAIQSIPDSGLGLAATKEVPLGSLLVTVPASVTLSVTLGSLGGPDDISVEAMCNDRRTFRGLPWYVQFSLYIYKLNNVSSAKSNVDLKPWLDSLPNTFDTPIRWDKKQRDELLQYQHMSESVDRQQEGKK
jgi:hypothetical protein